MKSKKLLKRKNRVLPYSRQLIDNIDIRNVVSVLKSDFLTQGNKVPQFENDLTRFTNAKFAVAVNSAIKTLQKIIIKRLLQKNITSSVVLTSKRQVENVILSKNYLENALKSLSSGTSLELVVEDLNSSLFYLDSITKKTTKDDVLKSVFSSFCVGK